VNVRLIFERMRKGLGHAKQYYYMEATNMGIYKNDYNKKEDKCLWEIHEIRNQLHKELKKKHMKRLMKKQS